MKTVDSEEQLRQDISDGVYMAGIAIPPGALEK
jgi:hypothetical protein